MKAANWIDQIKTRHGWDSDYRVAKEIGLSRGTISIYRTRQSTLDEEALRQSICPIAPESRRADTDQRPLPFSDIPSARQYRGASKPAWY